MLLLKRLIVVICLLILFIIGFYYILLPVPILGNFVKNEISKIEIDEIGMTLIYLLLVLMPLLVLTVYNRELRTKDEFVVKGPNGNISIAYDAVSRYVKNVLYGIESVEAVKTTLDQSKNGIIVNIAIKIKANRTLSEIEKEIRKRVKDGLSVILGLGKIDKINISFKEIAYKKRTYEEMIREDEAKSANVFGPPQGESPKENKEE